MDEYVLQMKNISKSFNGVKVLDDVAFALKKGHVHALVGGNGAGKSTLMKILTGVYTKDAGSISVFGKEVEFFSYGDANKAGIRMIFQELSLIPTQTVAENIFLNEELKKGILTDEKRMEEETKKILEQFGIDIHPRETVSNLSVGLCQLVEIAKALSKEAQILVMDEPTASLSDGEVKLLFNIVNILKEKGVSIIYISHRMNEILEISDEVTVLRDGKYVTTEDASSLTVEAIIGFMLGDKRGNSFSKRARNYPKEMTEMLRVEGLSVDNLVEDVSFSVKSGEVVGLAGLMGSGRTEILEALFGIRKIQKGKVFVEGRPVKIKCVQDAMDSGLALVPEDRRREGLVLEHTLKENIQLPIFKQTRKGLFLDKRKINAFAQKSVEALDIKTDGINKIVSLLSGGNQQKIVIAKWLNIDPKVLLLDEPTAGIDIGAKGEIINIVVNYADQGNSVVVVSSEIAELAAMCDRIIVLFDGKIVGELEQKDITDEGVIQHAIQG
jgi:ribose transport system ATP-binding protein